MGRECGVITKPVCKKAEDETGIRFEIGGQKMPAEAGGWNNSISRLEDQRRSVCPTGVGDRGVAASGGLL